jgi:hypothetical protein
MLFLGSDYLLEETLTSIKVHSFDIHVTTHGVQLDSSHLVHLFITFPVAKGWCTLQYFCSKSAEINMKAFPHRTMASMLNSCSMKVGWGKWE